MPKTDEEIASEIVQETLKARGQAIAGIGSNNSGSGANSMAWLKDEAVVHLYKSVLAAVKNSK